VTNQVSDPYKTTGKIIFLCILVFVWKLSIISKTYVIVVFTQCRIYCQDAEPVKWTGSEIIFEYFKFHEELRGKRNYVRMSCGIPKYFHFGKQSQNAGLLQAICFTLVWLSFLSVTCNNIILCTVHSLYLDSSIFYP
jgi:hypothetical protein